MRLGARLDRLGALGERNFRLLFFGQAATAVGDRMAALALAFAVLEITDSVSALGIVLACQTIPSVALMLVGGIWADRLPRGRVMVASDLIRFGSQGLSAALLIGGVAEVWHLAVLQAIWGASGAFFTPASQGLIPDTVRPDRLQQANVLLAMSRNATGIGGPALSGLLVATIGAGWAIGVDAATFGVSAAILSRLTIPARAPSARTPFLADLRSGWREFVSRTWVWASVVHFSLFQMVSLSTFVVLGPYVAKTELGGASTWATVMVAGSLGALAGGSTVLRRRPARPLVAVFGLTVLFAPTYFLLAAEAPVLVIAAGSFLGSAGMSSGVSIWFTALQERIPEAARSRVSSYDFFGSALFLPLGMALVGPVSQAIGISTTLVIAGLWTTASSAAIVAVPSIRGLRRLQLEERVEAAPVPVPTSP